MEKINVQFSVMTTSHISFSRVIRSWSAIINTLQTHSTFRDSAEKRKPTISPVPLLFLTVCLN